MSFGSKLRNIRLGKEVEQEDLAKLIGVSRSTISGLETDRISPEKMAAATLLNLARSLGMPPLYFMFESGLLSESELKSLPTDYYQITVEEKLLLETIVNSVGQFLDKKEFRSTYQRLKEAREDEADILADQMPDVEGRTGTEQRQPHVLNNNLNNSNNTNS